jgi:hypothetical protein
VFETGFGAQLQTNGRIGAGAQAFGLETDDSEGGARQLNYVGTEEMFTGN